MSLKLDNTTTPSPCISPSCSSSCSSTSSLHGSQKGEGVVVLGGSSESPSHPHERVVKECTCPTSLHTYNETYTRVYSQCPVCLSKFDPDNRTPIALNCSHTICVQCARLLIPESFKATDGCVVDGDVGVVNYPLLYFLDPGYSVEVGDEVVGVLCKIARLIRSNTVSRSVHRKTIVLVNSLTPDYGRVLKCVRSLGERVVVELTSGCAHVSHYHAQQQLWAAIRARACQFMGPAMQDEALRLVLLALEDGSALSRKVLVMFVVQRLAPQFPQASKTSVGHIVQLLYRASAFDVLKRPGNSSLMTLRPEFRNYEALRREHDTQIMKIGLEAGIRFTPEQWSSLLYGDTSQKPLMQSIIDKLQSPQTFQELLKEYLVSVQRLSNPDSQFLVGLHQHFNVLAQIDAEGRGGGDSPTDDLSTTLPQILESLHSVLVGLISFTANRKHQRTSRPCQNGGGSPNTGNYVNNTSKPPVPYPQQQYSPTGPPIPKKRHDVSESNERNLEMEARGVVGVNNNIVSMMQANLCI